MQFYTSWAPPRESIRAQFRRPSLRVAVPAVSAKVSTGMIAAGTLPVNVAHVYVTVNARAAGHVKTAAEVGTMPPAGTTEKEAQAHAGPVIKPRMTLKVMKISAASATIKYLVMVPLIPLSSPAR